MYIPFREAPPVKTTVFKNNRTQAVRIPKALAFPEGTKEVEIVRHGDGVLIQPKARAKFASWKEYFENRTPASDDFLANRDDQPPQDREFPWD
jgi:antitoxin VapB